MAICLTDFLGLATINMYYYYYYYGHISIQRNIAFGYISFGHIASGNIAFGLPNL